MPQRQSLRGPPQLRKSCSDFDALHRRSPRGAQPDLVNQKKLGTRIADLEFQLGQAQKELKILKRHLASPEKKTKKPEKIEPLKMEENYHPLSEPQESNRMDSSGAYEVLDDNHPETDVFEVPVEKETVEPKVEFGQSTDQEELKTEPLSISTEPLVNSEADNPSLGESVLTNDEISLLKAKLEEKEKELEVFREENERLKSQLNGVAMVRAKEEEMSLKLNQLGQELETSKRSEVQLNEKMESVEAKKEALETEMKKLRVQSEQWRKAADAAAAVLADGVEMNGKRISERCGSMSEPFGSVFEPPYNGDFGSLNLGNDSDDGFGNGKRKGSGIRMFGDLWKKRGQK